MTVRIRAGLAAMALVVCFAPGALAQGKVEYKVLSTSKTSTMEKEMQLAAALGFRYGGVTSTAAGGAEVVVIMTKVAEPVEFEYRLLATSKTSTMQKELSEAGGQGFEFVGLTVGKTVMGGDEIVTILRRDKAR